MQTLSDIVTILLETNPDATIKDCYTRQEGLVMLRSKEEVEFEYKVQKYRQTSFQLMKEAVRPDYKKETSK